MLFPPLALILTLIGGAAIQVGTNYTNTYGDYINGVDTVESNITQPQLVRGILAPDQMLKAGLGAFAFAATIGIYLVYLRGWPLLILGLLGILGGYGYTLGVAYKYKGLGTILVFFLMGPMMAWGAYYVQTGFHSWTPVLASLPIGFLISGLLHANDFRDIPSDEESGIKTLATILGFYWVALLLPAEHRCLSFPGLVGHLPGTSPGSFTAFAINPSGLAANAECKTGLAGEFGKAEVPGAETCANSFSIWPSLYCRHLARHPFLGG